MDNQNTLGDPLLDTAARTFDQIGWMGTTVERVAADANVPLKDALSRFPSREHLAVGIFEQVLRSIPEEFADEVEPHASLGTRLYFLLAHELRLLEPHKVFVRQALVDSVNPLSQLALLQTSLIQRYLGLVSEQIQVACNRGEISLLVVPSLAASGFWLLRGQVLVYWLADSSHGSERTHAQTDIWTKLFVRCLSFGLTEMAGSMIDSAGGAFFGFPLPVPFPFRPLSGKRGATVPATVLEGKSGERLSSTFLVTNTLPKSVKTAIFGSRFVSDAGDSVTLSFTFEPSVLLLNSGESASLHVSVQAIPEMVPHVDYRGEIIADQIPDARIPLIIRRRDSAKPSK